MAQRRRLFVLLYSASGAAALVYEVTWTRLLTLQLGHTVAAASTVLAAFMGGLALGAWVAGKRRGSTLRTYVVLELIVAVSALLLPIALGATVPALAWAYADGSAPAQFAVVRVAISLALLGVPAAAMGATFPIAADWYARNAADAGALYAVNTAGAAAGAIAAGFFLIPALGLRGTTWAGVLLNLVAASGAWWLSSQSRSEETAESAKTAEVSSSKNKKDKRGSAPSLRSPRSPRFLPGSPVLACAAAGLSGFAALIYEVAWTRLLALVIGPTTYAFATMAAAFISGLAIGSAVGTRIARRVERPAVWLSAMLVTSAIAASGAAWLTATRMPLLVAGQVADPAAAFTPVVLTQAFGTALLLLPMTLALGAAFRWRWPRLAPLRASGPSAGEGDGSTVARDAARLHRKYNRGDCRSAHGGLPR
jgi:spermidine synthase